MTPERSVPQGVKIHTPQPGYRWTCSMCRDLGLVEGLEEYGKLADCPKCETAHRFGIAFELVRRRVTPAVPASERLASPAVGVPSFIYEVWEFHIEEGTARRVAVENDVGAAYMAKWDLEEEAYGSIRMGT